MTKHQRDLDSLFANLADPTRRAVLARLAHGPATVTDLAQGANMALPSFLQHLRRLEDAGLIATQKAGRVRTCALQTGALAPARDWMAEQRLLWEGRLDRLEEYLAHMAATEDTTEGPHS
jgi:DNA-binding transcriptional ArsR family regulator